MGIDIPIWIALAGMATSAAATGVSTARGIEQQRQVAKFQRREVKRTRALAALQIAMNTAGATARARQALAIDQAQATVFGPTLHARAAQIKRNALTAARKENFGVSQRAFTAESAARMREETAKAQSRLIAMTGAMRIGSTLINTANMMDSGSWGDGSSNRPYRGPNLGGGTFPMGSSTRDQLFDAGALIA